MSRDFFKNIEVKVPHRSGEDLSFQHLFSSKCGTLVPALWHEVIPGTKVYLKSALSVSLPPLASDTYMRVKYKTEAFFVPFRQIVGSFSAWLTGEKLVNVSNGNEQSADIPTATITVANPSVASNIGAGSLTDYLGFKLKAPSGTFTAVQKSVNLMPYLAYHWIWDNMYRNSRIQRRAFSVPSGGASPAAPRYAAYLPYVNSNSVIGIGSHSNLETLGDGMYLSDLRQRNFDADYFTNMTLNPQSVTNPSAVSFTVDSQGNGSFTIATLRAQNSLQLYLERQNLAGFRLTEWCNANYGVNLHEGIAQMPVFLGRQSLDVYSKGIETNAETSGVSNNNPFAGTVGARYGNAYAIGNDVLIDEFEAKEPGIIMVLCSLVPKVTYSTGIDPLLKHFNNTASQLSSIPNPLLQNTGQQAVRAEELCDRPNANSPVFGFTDRFSEMMTKIDRVSGILKDGESLQSFCLQRSFSTDPQLNSSFLEIPTTYLDQISAVSSTISQFGYWCDSFWEFKISHPLHAYSIPSLQDPAYEHGKGVIIDRSAQIVN